MLGHDPLSTRPLSDVAAGSAPAALPFTPSPSVSQSAPSAKKQLGYAFVATNLLLTTLAAVTTTVVRESLAFGPQQKRPVVAEQFVNNTVLGIPSAAVSLPFIQQQDESAPGPKRQVFIADPPPRLIGKTLPDYAPSGDVLYDSAPASKAAVYAENRPSQLTTGIPTGSAAETPFVQRLDQSAPRSRYNVSGPLLPGRSAAPTVVDQPVGQRLDSSAPVGKSAVYAENRPSQLTTGIPVEQVVSIPQGVQVYDSAPAIKAAVYAENKSSQLTTGIPYIAPFTAGALSESAPSIKGAVSSLTTPNLLETTLAIAAQEIPVGRQLDQSAPPPKVATPAPLFPTRPEQPAGVTPDALPIGQVLSDSAPYPKRPVVAENRSSQLTLGIPVAVVNPLPIGQPLYGSAPPPKYSVQVDIYQNILPIGLPPGLPVWADFDAAPSVKYQPKVDVYPNLLATTLAPVVQAIPVGQRLFDSAPPPPYRVVAQNYSSALTTGIPLVALPVGQQAFESIARQKYEVVAENRSSILTTGIPVISPPEIPLGLPVDTSQFMPKYAVQVDVYPNTLILDIPPPVVVPPTETLPVGGGGGGGRIYYKGKPGKDAAWLLNKMLDDVVAEVMYRDIQQGGTEEEKARAAKLVRSYAEDRKADIPVKVDWIALEADANRVGQMLSIWRRIELVKRRRKSEEEWLFFED